MWYGGYNYNRFNFLKAALGYLMFLLSQPSTTKYIVNTVLQRYHCKVGDEHLLLCKNIIHYKVGDEHLVDLLHISPLIGFKGTYSNGVI